MTILVQSRPSNGASTLVGTLVGTGVSAMRRRADSARRLRRRSFLVNWGVTNIPVDDERLEPHLNHQNSVATAVDKAWCFHALKETGVSIPYYITRHPSTVENDMECVWLARHLVKGSGGDGITVVRPGDDWPAAPLYVKYIPKLVEFRVHVFKQASGFSFLNRQKLRESNAEQDRDQRLIRNRDNGWVFGLVRDEDGAAKAQAEAEKAVAALGLDFGAVDVIIGRDDGVAYVLEVNTAPGMEAQPVIDFYASNVLKRYNNWRQGNG